MTTNTELSPCPFCGGSATLSSMSANMFWCVSCDVCEANIDPFERSKENAIQKWNTRTNPAALEAQARTLPAEQGVPVAWQYRFKFLDSPGWSGWRPMEKGEQLPGSRSGMQVRYETRALYDHPAVQREQAEGWVEKNIGVRK